MSAPRTKVPRMTSKNPGFQRNLTAWKAFSLMLSGALDLLGSSYNAIKTRQRCMETVTHYLGCAIIAGSKAEGIARQNKRDTDCIILFNMFACTDDINDVDEAGNTVVLLADRVGTSPGYTKVKVAYPADIGDFDCFFRNQAGEVQLSSLLFKDMFSKLLKGSSFNGETSNGPASTFAVNLVGHDFPADQVIAIPYKCKTLMRAWMDRPRCNNWPDDNTIQEVSQLDWHIVPIGSDKDGDGFHDWRICFTLGEQYLIKTFNETQLHLLVLLKNIADNVLKPVCPAITSYVMKNIVLWMSEILPQKRFKPRNLSFLLVASLTILRSAVDNRHLKNYMIPARNLLKDKITSDERREGRKLLESLLGMGPAFLVQIQQFSAIRDAMEKLYKDPGAAGRETSVNDNFEAMGMFFSALLLPNPQQLLPNIVSRVVGQIGSRQVGYLEETILNCLIDSMKEKLSS